MIPKKPAPDVIRVGTGFRKGSCSTNKLDRDDDSKKSHSVLGRLAQLVERLLYTQDVGGSSPSPPTSLRACGASAGKPALQRADRPLKPKNDDIRVRKAADKRFCGPPERLGARW